MKKRPLRRFSAAELSTIRRLAAAGLSAGEIGEYLGRDRGSIRAAAERAGIDITPMRRRIDWTPEQDAQLRELYPTRTGMAVAEIMGVSINAVYNRAATLGLGKAPGFASKTTRARWREGRHENSRKHQFKPGEAPYNKGMPASEWMPEDSRARCAKTQFRPGRPAREARNYKPIGSLRVNQGQLERKMTDDPRLAPTMRWTAVARLVWEATHGPVPDGHIVRFKEGRHTVDEAEITVDRLECISRVENMKRNSYHTRYPKEVARLIQLKGALNRKINTREKASNR